MSMEKERSTPRDDGDGGAEQVRKVKRTADRQITKDDNDDDDDSSTEENSGTFEKASDAVLKKRRIVRASWPGAIPPTTSADEKKHEDSAKNNKEKEDETKTENDKNDSKTTKSEEKSEETAANPFSAVSFSSAAKTNPFAAAFAPQTDKTDTKSTDSKKEKSSSSGFGSFAGGFGSSFGSSGFGSSAKPLFGSSTTTGTLFGKISTKSSSSVFGSTTGFMSTSQNTTTNTTSSFFSNKSNTYVTPFGTSKDGNNNNNNNNNGGNHSNNGDDDNTEKQSNAAEDSSLVLTNGEEGFECIFQTRAKLFKRLPVEEKETIETGNTTGTTQSVPPSTSTSIGSQSVPASSETKSTEEKLSDKSKSDKNRETTEKEEKTSTKMDWKEIGIGPLRILKLINSDNVDNKTQNTGDDKTENKEKSTTTPKVGMNRLRVVQRRESTPGGTGTKLILNLNLHPACVVDRQADKFVRMSAFEISDNETSPDAKDDDTKEQQIVPVNYLFRVKTVTEGDELEIALKKAIAVCAK